MTLKPLFDRVILLPEKADKTSTAGIILPTVSEQKSSVATVVSVGQGGSIDGKDVAMQVKPNDRVLYSKYAGTEFKSEGEMYIIIRQSDILAVIEK